MKKYYLKSTNEEIKVGSKITIQQKVNTSYGEGIVTTDFVVTEASLEKLISDGFVEVKDDWCGHMEKLKPYVRRFGRTNGLNFPMACLFLQTLHSASTRAFLQVMLEVIAEVKNRDKERKKETYYLNPLGSYKPVPIIGDYEKSIVFYSAKDALEVHKLMLPFIEEIVNGK